MATTPISPNKDPETFSQPPLNPYFYTLWILLELLFSIQNWAPQILNWQILIWGTGCMLSGPTCPGNYGKSTETDRHLARGDLGTITLHYDMLYTVYCILSTIYYLLSTIYYISCNIYYTISYHTILCTIHTVLGYTDAMHCIAFHCIELL